MKNYFSLLLLISLWVMVPINLFSQENKKDTATKVLKEVTVISSYSAVKTTPFTFLNMPSDQIQSLSFGTDPAVVISGTPSVTFYSDNGDGYGYTYWRLRGIDQTRLNATLNGVPLNEPEDQGVYYNNYGGFLNSISSIQIIRGAGLSKPGVSSYGGSINFNSLEFADKFSGFTNIIYGMDNTAQLNVGINTPNLFVAGSLMTNDGFREHSFNRSKSIFYGGKIINGKNEFRIYGFFGDQKNGMAWIGETMDSINSNPVSNANTAGETDHFDQLHNQFSWKRGIFKAIVYYTYLNGWYTTDMGHFDPTHQIGDLMNKTAVKSNWEGAILNLNPTNNILSTNFGISMYTYSREHTGTYNKYNSDEPWYYSYTNTGYRDELAPYAKANIKIKKLSIYGDIQYRYTDFRYIGLSSMNTLKWNFLNWSTGISFLLNSNTQLYYGLGKTSREPTRTDLFLGSDDKGDTLNPISPETALNNEFGIKYANERFSINANLYYMKFKNEIVLNGQYGSNSIILHQNAAKSFRSGLEIDAKYKSAIGFDLLTATTFAFNRINQNGQKIEPVMSPKFLSSSDIVYNLRTFAYLGLNARVNGKSYIDFSNEHSIPTCVVYSCYAGINWKGFDIKGYVNNLSGKLVLNNANIGFDGQPRYFPTLGRYWILALTYRF